MSSCQVIVKFVAKSNVSCSNNNPQPANNRHGLIVSDSDMVVHILEKLKISYKHLLGLVL